MEDRELMKSDDKFAVLIDAENISHQHIDEILSELSKYGRSTVRRIYGDWTNTAMSGWKKILSDNAISPIQQYSIVSGKNSTDSAMIIDAMDILYSDNVDGFCLVTSDSDFTKLATRIRESGLTVIGMGEKKTLPPFRRACDLFYVIGNKDMTEEETENDKNETEKPDDIPQRVKDYLSGMEGNVYVTEIKSYLLKVKSDFNEKDYGFSKFSDFLRSIDGVEVKSIGSNNKGAKTYVASLK